ncbi:MAG: hypothetical protein B7Z10_08925 [Rhodobacterales bacterium 32-66-7]|nr:MAG: hypothetical protein B7Z31_03195 [Rhodobacterales bacterium 12-65-15]OYX24584.1 MAG: hypothetical protein B7Z10_08925 [Rhodobacterales bacterium 32-66-7]
MADADYDDFGTLSLDPSRQGRAASPVQRWVHLTGAVVSLGLLAAFGIWAFRLAELEVTGVPVVRAVEGPMRIVPADPGGVVVDFQGLAVNDVAADGGATDLPEVLTLAPRPMDLAAEDVAGLAGGSVAALAGLEEVLAPSDGLAPAGAADLALAAEPKVESASPTALAVDAALAEALGLAAESDPAEAVLPEVEPLPLGTIVTSPRPIPRPELQAVAATAEPTAALPPVEEIDPQTIPLGTRLVQFGTFDTVEEARAAWAKLAAEFGDLMVGKAMVLQPAESNGRNFWRLRAHGFEDEADARRFCVAFAEQELICIPVPQR